MAQRYRAWAAKCQDEQLVRGLSECAEREDRLASLIEAAFAIPAGYEAAFVRPLQKITQVVQSTFKGRSFMEQLAIQAAAERRGASAWRSFTGLTENVARADILLLCASIEEERGFLRKGHRA